MGNGTWDKDYTSRSLNTGKQKELDHLQSSRSESVK